MSNPNWKYTYFTERQINEKISNILARRKQKEQVVPEIQKLLGKSRIKGDEKMKTTEEIKQKLFVSFEGIVDSCETIGDLQKLHEEVIRWKTQLNNKEKQE